MTHPLFSLRNRQCFLVTGCRGQLGWELHRALLALGEVVGIDRAEVDLTSERAIDQLLTAVAPTCIVNAAAYTAVDQAEQITEQPLAYCLNRDTVGWLARRAEERSIPFVHFSTDYIFDGKKVGAYLENDPPAPLSHYGMSKAQGENAARNLCSRHLIFRTSWVYGSRGHNFLLTMLRLAKERTHLSIVNDQWGAPTSSRWLASATAYALHRLLLACSETEQASFWGTYHLTCSGSTSWHGFAEKIFSEAHQTSSLCHQLPELSAISSDDYPTAAKRPLNSRLSSAHFTEKFLLTPPSWEECLSLALAELAEDSAARELALRVNTKR